MTLYSSESSSSNEFNTYENINYELKNVQNVLGVLLITILKFRNNFFYKNTFPKLADLKKNDAFFDILRTKMKFNNTSENLKCGNL